MPKPFSTCLHRHMTLLCPLGHWSHGLLSPSLPSLHGMCFAPCPPDILAGATFPALLRKYFRKCFYVQPYSAPSEGGTPTVFILRVETPKYFL